MPAGEKKVTVYLPADATILIRNFEINADMFPVEKGDKVLFYSDGLVEAKNKNGQVYGQDKLEIFLKNNHKLNSIELNSSLKNDFFEHINYSNKLADDVTFLTMSIKD